jgi:hypothetical protein
MEGEYLLIQASICIGCLGVSTTLETPRVVTRDLGHTHLEMERKTVWVPTIRFAFNRGAAAPA